MFWIAYDADWNCPDVQIHGGDAWGRECVEIGSDHYWVADYDYARMRMLILPDSWWAPFFIAATTLRRNARRRLIITLYRLGLIQPREGYRISWQRDFLPLRWLVSR